MNRLFSLLLLSLTICGPQTILAQKQLPPKGTKPKDFKLPPKQTFALGNGFKTTTVQYGNVRKVTISLIIATGSIHETPAEPWLSKLTAEMIKQGSVTKDFKTISREIAAMGGTLNITSGRETTTLGGTVLSEFADSYIAVIADLIMHPRLPASELERLKDDLKRNLSVDKNSPYYIANNAFRNAIFAGHPLATMLSTEQIINGFTTARVKDFYAQNFGAKRASLYIVGKFDPATIPAAVRKAFNTWPPGPDVFNNKTPDIVTRGPIIVDRPDSKQTYLIIGRPTIPVTDKDYIALYVADALVGGAFGSRITRNIREEKGYSYSPYSYLTAIAGAPSLWTENAEVTSEHAIDAMAEIEKEIKKLGEEAPAATELGGVQGYLSGLFVIQNSDPAGIIHQLDFLQRHKLPDSFLTGFVKSINEVTPTQVQAVVKRQLDRSKMTVVIVGDKNAILKQMESAEPKKAF